MEKRRHRHWSVVIAPLTRAIPSKNSQFDAGFTVGAPGRNYACEVLAAVLDRCLKYRLLFDGLTLSALEEWFRTFSKNENFKVSPRMLRHAGPSRDLY